MKSERQLLNSIESFIFDNAMQCNAMQCNAMQCNTIQSTLQ